MLRTYVYECTYVLLLSTTLDLNTIYVTTPWVKNGLHRPVLVIKKMQDRGGSSDDEIQGRVSQQV